MYLVLASPGDACARWAYAGLRERRLEPLEWVGLEMLAAAERWEHRVGAEGARVEIDLADGRRIRSDRVAGVLNRLVRAPGIAPEGAHPEDREYAEHELAAFYASWLHALPSPVLNRPVPFGLCGAWRHPSEWVWMAARAGLPAPDFRLASDAPGDPGAHGPPPPGAAAPPAYVVAGEVVAGALPAALHAGCRRLAELAGAALLGVRFTAGPGDRWTFAGATPFPELAPGGDALLDALARALRGREAA